MTRAVLKQVGKVDSCKQRFNKVVIGGRSVSMHALRTTVGMKSSAHVASEEESIAALTSALVAGSNLDRSGGGTGGGGGGGTRNAIANS